ncbi:MAG: TIGR03086 family protein, partial [Actinomyces sp.]
PEHRELATPCRKWTVHDLVGHMVGGAAKMAAALDADPAAGADPDGDPLAAGPAQAWADASARLASAATPENLGAERSFPFGTLPGAMGLSVIVADHLTHAWDLARATGQELDVDDELAAWAHQVWSMVLSDELRNGDAFDVEQPCPAGAPAIDRLAAFTGRPVV